VSRRICWLWHCTN